MEISEVLRMCVALVGFQTFVVDVVVFFLGSIPTGQASLLDIPRLLSRRERLYRICLRLNLCVSSFPVSVQLRTTSLLGV